MVIDRWPAVICSAVSDKNGILQNQTFLYNCLIQWRENSWKLLLEEFFFVICIEWCYICWVLTTVFTWFFFLINTETFFKKSVNPSKPFRHYEFNLKSPILFKYSTKRWKPSILVHLNLHVVKKYQKTCSVNSHAIPF